MFETKGNKHKFIVFPDEMIAPSLSTYMMNNSESMLSVLDLYDLVSERMNASELKETLSSNPELIKMFVGVQCLSKKLYVEEPTKAIKGKLHSCANRISYCFGNGSYSFQLFYRLRGELLLELQHIVVIDRSSGSDKYFVISVINNVVRDNSSLLCINGKPVRRLSCKEIGVTIFLKSISVSNNKLYLEVGVVDNEQHMLRDYSRVLNIRIENGDVYMTVDRSRRLIVDCEEEKKLDVKEVNNIRVVMSKIALFGGNFNVKGWINE